MNANSLIFVFPGQGTQITGMGSGLFEQFPDITKAADETLGYSIKTLCLENPRDQLNQTEYTQPALYTVNAMTYLSVKQETGRVPDFVAGHSLGEYNALFAAGVFDFATGLRLVQKRGELMAQATGGGMAAIIGLTRDQIRDVILLFGSPEVTIANLNAPKQTVISGSMSAIEEIQSSFEEAGASLFLPLTVSGAFHSRFMEPARRQFETFLKSFNFNQPAIPVISNVEALPYPGDDVANLLAQQVTSPVRWVESIQYLLRQPNPTFREIGPGDTLQSLLRQISS
ncbi:MAG: ACP S-malonyltransferase [Pseudanabaenales cyanobacterium]|nr:ACP S-malonyltransferase [Pseudanabaenales cyanobacterium]